MGLDLILGGAVALAAYAVLVGLVVYNRHIIEIVHRHRVSNIREVKKVLEVESLTSPEAETASPPAESPPDA